jgi:hypothetical protein
MSTLLSGDPVVVFASGIVPASATSKAGITSKTPVKYPITLNAAGAVRANGTLTLLVSGIGGTSQCYYSMNWKEIR